MAIAILGSLLLYGVLAAPQCGAGWPGVGSGCGGPVLRRVDEGVSDRDPLSVSLRNQQVDLRQPVGFSGVYQVEGTDLFVRRSGALWAVFPRGLYSSRDGKAIVLPPAGMVYSIGTPHALRQEPRATSAERVGGIDLSLGAGFDDPQGPRSDLMVRLDRRIDHASRAAAIAGDAAPPIDRATTRRADRPAMVAMPDVTDEKLPRFMDDEPYRRSRLARLLAGPDGGASRAEAFVPPEWMSATAQPEARREDGEDRVADASAADRSRGAAPRGTVAPSPLKPPP